MLFGKTVIRPATSDDADSLVKLGERLAKTDPFLVVSGFDPVTGASLIQSAIKDGARTQSSRIFVAANEAELAGLAICRRHPAPERDSIVQLDLGVDEKYRRRGFGNTLVHQAIDWARTTGAHRVQLAVVADNAAAISLYQKHGFEIEGTLRQGFRLESRFYDVHVMARLLI